jgi:hypothetical protein
MNIIGKLASPIVNVQFENVQEFERNNIRRFHICQPNWRAFRFISKLAKSNKLK